MRVGRILRNVFREGDIAICRPLRNLDHAFLVPLQKDKSLTTHNGSLSHSDILGKPKRIYLPFTKSRSLKNPAADKFVVTEPTLEEYVALCRRRAQPIYAMDALVVAQMGDIDPYGDTTRHYLEAGTGNGSLTLALCQQIHAANAAARTQSDRNLRGAVLHSVDRNATHQEMGKHNVESYKRGRFVGDVDFQIAESPAAYLESTNLTLHGVFLDLPDPHLYLGRLAKALDLQGTIVVFCPSITQLLKCKQIIADEKIDIMMVRALELPPGNGGGTREWDVTSVYTRATNERVDICRPKVGEKVVGGGFIGVFKRKSLDGTLY